MDATFKIRQEKTSLVDVLALISIFLQLQPFLLSTIVVVKSLRSTELNICYEIPQNPSIPILDMTQLVSVGLMNEPGVYS